MESKRISPMKPKVNAKLLIEPVWNRNFGLPASVGDGYLLLIEPIWNRNIFIDDPEDLNDYLLIELV